MYTTRTIHIGTNLLNSLYFEINLGKLMVTYFAALLIVVIKFDMEEQCGVGSTHLED